jgi:hypothetical protein
MALEEAGANDPVCSASLMNRHIRSFPVPFVMVQEKELLFSYLIVSEVKSGCEQAASRRCCWSI